MDRYNKSSDPIASAKSLAELPTLLEAPLTERLQLLIRKLQLCCRVYDFYDEKKHVREKDAKKLALLEIAEYIADNSKGALKPKVATEVIKMVRMNIFRHFGVHKRSKQPKNEIDGKTANGDVEEDEARLEEAWPHLQIVYDILVRFILSKSLDGQTINQYITKEFMIKFMNLFHSEDPRERDYLKTILHRIYGKSMVLRSFIRRLINDQLCAFVYEDQLLHGAGELLEILGSIINGFAVPLKEEHLKFLTRILIPLHKVPTVGAFHSHLSYCITQFVEKDPTTTKPVLLGLLRLWPITGSSKEILFLNELEEVLEFTKPPEFEEILTPLFQQIGRSMSSPHFQVSQRALFLWNNEHLINLVAVHRVEILPLIFGYLYKNIENHWHTTVQTLTYNVLKLFMEMDSELFDQCAAHHAAREEREKQKTDTRKTNWKTMEKKCESGSIPSDLENSQPISARSLSSQGNNISPDPFTI